MTGTKATAAHTIFWVCLAQTLAQIGAFAFPALLPTFIPLWQLSHTQAGWLAGIFFGAYAAGVPILVTLTDRVDPRRIYIVAVALTTAAHAGMALFAEGFVSALILRILAGLGWAGTYMVGLRVLTDQLDGRLRSRGVAFHATSIGLSGSLSFVVAGQSAALWDWRAAFVIGGCGALAAFLIACLRFPLRRIPLPNPPAIRQMLDFRPIFRNRSAMAYISVYLIHTWEMFVLRSWAVTFLVFTAHAHGVTHPVIPAVMIAMGMELVGTFTTLFGNEAALRLGRQRWIMGVLLISLPFAAIVGFSAHWGYGVAAAVLLIYNGLIYADSSALTAGTVGTAEDSRRGATLAVHAMLGYFGGFVGPLVMGILLDLLGGENLLNWGLAFSHLVLLMAVGPLVLSILRPRDVAGDKAVRGG